MKFAEEPTSTWIRGSKNRSSRTSSGSISACATTRRRVSRRAVFNATPTASPAPPDLSRPATNEVWDKSANLKLAWQPSPKSELSTIHGHHAPLHLQPWLQGHDVSRGDADRPLLAQLLGEASWTYVPSSRVVIEAGVGSSWGKFRYNPQKGVSPDAIDLVGPSTGSRTTRIGLRSESNQSADDSVSADIRQRRPRGQVRHQRHRRRSIATNATGHSVSYRFDKGVPNQVTAYASPAHDRGGHERRPRDLRAGPLDDPAPCAHCGLRLGYFNGSVPARTRPRCSTSSACRRRRSRVLSYPAVKNVPKWTDLNPRVAAVYDLFGDGRTAIGVPSAATSKARRSASRLR